MPDENFDTIIAASYQAFYLGLRIGVFIGFVVGFLVRWWYWRKEGG